MKAPDMFGSAIGKAELIKLTGLALIKAKPRRASMISVGPGLNQMDDDVCVCGHWSSAHRGSMNAAACEGFRCGCYTFRQIENPDDSTQGPRCQQCKKPVLGKRVDTIPDRKNAFTVTYVHAERECVTQGSAVVEKDEVVKEMYWPKVNEDTVVELPKYKTITTNTTNLDDRPAKKLGPSDWAKEIEQERKKRDAPTRAPFEIGGDEHV